MASITDSKHHTGGYASLLSDGGFQGFLWTQFLGAFNDNIYIMIVSVDAVELVPARTELR